MGVPRLGIKCRILCFLALIGATLSCSSVAKADFTVFTGSGLDENKMPFDSARVTFRLTGNTLTIDLTNTSKTIFNNMNKANPTDILTALFFNISTNPVLTPISAFVGAGSTVVNAQNSAQLGPNVGGEWQYLNTNPMHTPNRQNQGISSTGIFDFGMANFNGPELNSPPVSLDGYDYGMIGSGYRAGTGNGQISTTPIVRDTTEFKLTVPAGFSLRQISNVTFLYGTGNNEVNFPGIQQVPGPPALLLALSGLAGISFTGLRRFCRRPGVA